jgi:hypothetical protein
LSELARYSIPARPPIPSLIEVDDDDHLPMAAIAQAAGASDFFADELDVYNDADMIEDFRAGARHPRGS